MNSQRMTSTPLTSTDRPEATRHLDHAHAWFLFCILAVPVLGSPASVASHIGHICIAVHALYQGETQQRFRDASGNLPWYKFCIGVRPPQDDYLV